MKKSIVRTSLALAVAGVLGTSVVGYAAEAPQVQPVPVVKEAVQTAPVVKQEATAPVQAVAPATTAPTVNTVPVATAGHAAKAATATKIDVSAAIKPVANENSKPAVT